MTSPESTPPHVAPAPTSHISSDSDSSSDSDIAVPLYKNNIPVHLKLTSIKQTTLSKALTLLTGDFTPAIMCEFEDTCLRYFENKEILPEKQVHKILAGLKDYCIKEWLSVDRACIHRLKFLEFMSEFCAAYLLKD